jgi:hypothetical protein
LSAGSFSSEAQIREGGERQKEEKEKEPGHAERIGKKCRLG